MTWTQIMIPPPPRPYTPVQVRDNAMHTISLFAKIGGSDLIAALITNFEGWCAAPRQGPGGRVRLAGCLGLAGIVHAFPFSVPRFIPKALCDLAAHANDSCEIAKSVRQVFADWWRSHSDEWHFGFKDLFTEDELSVVTNMLYCPSYYA